MIGAIDALAAVAIAFSMLLVGRKAVTFVATVRDSPETSSLHKAMREAGLHGMTCYRRSDSLTWLGRGALALCTLGLARALLVVLGSE
jgi:hypothetical protein